LRIGLSIEYRYTGGAIIKRRVRLKRNIRRTVLILAAGVVASAAIAQQSNPYGESNRLIALKEIT